MKQCPECRRVYADDFQAFCLNDGVKLVEMRAEPSAAPVVPDLPVPPPTPPAVLPSFSDREAPFPRPEASATPPMPPLPFPAPPPPGPQSLPQSPNYAKPAAKQSASIPVFVTIPLLLLLVLFGAYRLITFVVARRAHPVVAATGAPALPTFAPPVVSPSAPPTEQAPVDEATLKSAIRLADDAEAEALRTLDPAPLSQAYTGEALRAELKKVDDLKAKGLYIQAHLDNQEIQSVQVSPDNTKAEVKIVETWTTAFYSSANKQLVQSNTGQPEPQTISLVRGADGWLVYADNPQ
jgi:hypothetical protein